MRVMINNSQTNLPAEHWKVDPDRKGQRLWKRGSPDASSPGQDC